MPSARTFAECRARGLKYSPHTWSNGIGFTINLHAFAAWEKRELLEYPYEPPGWIPEYREGILEPILTNPDGTVDVPQEPGLGLRIDPARLKKYAKRFFKVTPLRVALKVIREKGFKTAMELKRKRDARA